MTELEKQIEGIILNFKIPVYDYKGEQEGYSTGKAFNEVFDSNVTKDLAKQIADRLEVDWVKLMSHIELEREKIRKPDYVFVKGFYPSSGVERMVKQQEQIMDVAKALSTKQIIRIRGEKRGDLCLK